MFVCLQGGPQKDTNESSRDALEKHPQSCFRLGGPGPGQVTADQGGWGSSVFPKKPSKGFRDKDFRQAGQLTSAQGLFALSTTGL